MMFRRALLAAVLASSFVAAAEEYALDYTERPSRAAAAKAVDPDSAASGILREFTLGTAEAPSPDAYAVGDVIRVALFPDVSLAVQLVERTPALDGRVTFLATSEGYGDACNAVVAVTPEGVQIDVQDYLRGRVYTVASGPNGVTVAERDPLAGERTCAACSEPLLPAAPAAAAAAGMPIASSERSAGSTFVDIMVAYDTRAADYAAAKLGGITNFAETCVQKMNTALANTGLTSSFRFRLVGVFAAPGDAGGSLGSVLNSLTNPNTTLNGYGWSAVEEVRAACAADVVSVLIDNGSAWGTTGRGFSYTSASGSGFARSAYNACLIRAVADGHTMTHEVGHNMGAGHATEVEPGAIDPGPQYYDYSAGHYFSAGGEDYCTIMAYNYDGFGGYYTQIPYFSSPAHYYKGAAVGDALHDNTRTLRNTFAAVAKFRIADLDVDDVGAALGLSGYRWRTTGTYPWSLADDHGVVRSCEMAGASTSVLYTDLVGPATVTFSAYFRAYGGTFTVGYDDVTPFRDEGHVYYGNTFSKQSVSIPAGVHRLKLSYTHSATGFTSGGNGFWLKSLAISGGRPHRPTYTVVFNRNDGSGMTAEQVLGGGETVGLTTLGALGWARRGFVFKGWATSSGSRTVRYANGAGVRDIAGYGETLNLHAVWQLADGYYEIRFNKFDGSGAWRSVAFPYGEKTRLPTVANGLGWAKRGFAFAGWALTSSQASAGTVWKGDWAYVATPVAAGKTLDVWAAWQPKPGYYILRFVRNDGTSAWRAVGFEYGVKTRLPTVANGLGWGKRDRVFKGWSLTSDGDVWKGDWAYVTAPFPPGSVKYVYAVWE